MLFCKPFLERLLNFCLFTAAWVTLALLHLVNNFHYFWIFALYQLNISDGASRPLQDGIRRVIILFNEEAIEGYHIERLRVGHEEVRKLLRLNIKNLRDLNHSQIVFGEGREKGEEIHITRLLDFLDHILHKFYSPVVLNFRRWPVFGIHEDQTICLEGVDGGVSSLTPPWSANYSAKVRLY